jgi:hypothetical protein
MPYYQCPKCSGRDTYEGTELVSGSSGGGAIIGPENDLGFSPVVGTGGSKTIDQVTVVKCKKCDIILGDKDVQYTQEEFTKKKKHQEQKEQRAGDILYGVVAWIIIAILVIFILFSSITAE